MFIQDNDLVEIKIYCRKIKSRYTALTEQEFKEIEEESKNKYELFTVKMRELTWGLFNQLQDEALVETQNGDTKFNYRIYKETRLKKLIKDWSAKDKDGKPLPVNDSNISHLAPQVAEAILKSYDELSVLGEEEEGK